MSYDPYHTYVWLTFMGNVYVYINIPYMDAMGDIGWCFLVAKGHSTPKKETHDVVVFPRNVQIDFHG